MACQTLAKVLRRSVGHSDAPPITSFQLRYPLQIHAELMTHRVFSRNARSSRAVPTERMLAEVMNDPFVPRYWGANQKGMQAGVEHDANVELYAPFSQDGEPLDNGWRWLNREQAWLWARDRAAEAAKEFARVGYHKQIANRLLAPFLHIDVVLTTTDLSNWDALRDHDMAEPHIRDLACAMKQALADYGPPTQLQPGEWHRPYIDLGDLEEAWHFAGKTENGVRMVTDEMEAALTAMSVTRCAQVSYTPFHEARLTVAEEVARHDMLVTARPMHASPCEHQALPDTRLPNGNWANPHLAGNLGPGWIQYRKTLSGERA